MLRRTPLEKAAEMVCKQSSVPPLIFQLPPSKGRKILEQAQNTPVYMYPCNISTAEVNTGIWGTIPVYYVMPEHMSGIQNMIFYIHGAGWVFGSFHTHEKLVRELAYRTGSLVVFPEYSRSPEAKYPVAIEQCYYILSNIREIIQNHFHNKSVLQKTFPYRLITAGDSVGGNMTIAMALMSMKRNGPDIHKQLLYYPVTNACFNTPTYHEYSMGYYLYRAGMIWFWNQYIRCESDKNKITVSPLRASINDLKNLPETMIICGQADVLRSEGEAFAEKLLVAGVSVTTLQIQGIIHDFVMLNSLDKTNACRIAMDASTEWIL